MGAANKKTRLLSGAPGGCLENAASLAAQVHPVKDYFPY
jgi:hypothetical protein